MQEVARDNNVPFVDLLAGTSVMFNIGNEDMQHTINGVHLNELGNMQPWRWTSMRSCLAFGNDSTPLIDKGLRDAVIDKNWYWFHRYRTTDGYSTYGGRADLAFTDGQTNREVVQRELEVLDYLTAERDKKIRAIAVRLRLHRRRQRASPVHSRDLQQTGCRPQRRAPVPVG